ncbi:hypothetical protein K431DRAFT_229696 [Polychaeton citri CBS 116435]|uniref:Uncharacterized protein n=1 Tax=Polychaeton citri CBS 116435 TaxID=1314669 RepID=A0A9P4Q449_9PEZI|nr:hypothetical protein K431DRAFT_229696 [Polychaeton citri CBS 116435]
MASKAQELCASHINLNVSLKASTTSNPPTLQATISNSDSSRPMTVLSWDNILDENALNLGVFQFSDAETGSKLDIQGLKVNRRLPPPRGDLIEIQPASKVTREIPLKSRLLPSGGKTYRVKAAGNWKAVWVSNANEVGDQDLAAMSGPHVLSGTFESNEVEVKLS